jgi:hypothetical protein
MCHEWWELSERRGERRRQERFDEELRYLFDEAERAQRPAPIVDHDREAEPGEPERPAVEVGVRD